MNRELLKQVLDALKLAVLRSEKIIDKEYDAAITALEAELAKPAPEPVGYVYWNKGHAEGALDNQNLKPGTPLYAAPTEPTSQTRNCSHNPDAPHGFDRNGSHAAGRYMCECENWAPGEAS